MTLKLNWGHVLPVAKRLTKQNLPKNIDPPKSVTPAQLAGDSRAKGVIEHLLAVRAELHAACRDFCSVKGASHHYRAMVKLGNQVDELVHEINLDYARTSSHPFQLSLDRELTDADVDAHHACAIEDGYQPPEAEPASRAGPSVESDPSS